MSRILLADASPHAQRMGLEILREEGYQVEAAADGPSALALLASFDPLVIIADVQLPGKSGYDLSREAKSNPDAVVAVILTAGARAGVPDPERFRNCGGDEILSKPFEATELLGTVRRLAQAVEAERLRRRPKPAPLPGELDRERIEAAVTLALEAALPALIQEITERVLIALKQ